jgi:hypothetical protein
MVRFSEPVEKASAETIANYSMNNGIKVTGAAFITSDPRYLTLATSPLTSGVTYTLTVNNVRDRALKPNTIAANTHTTFTVKPVRPPRPISPTRVR